MAFGARIWIMDSAAWTPETDPPPVPMNRRAQLTRFSDTDGHKCKFCLLPEGNFEGDLEHLNNGFSAAIINMVVLWMHGVWYIRPPSRCSDDAALIHVKEEKKKPRAKGHKLYMLRV